MEDKLQGQASDTQIADWKKQYSEVLYTKADGHIAYFRKPNRQEVSYAMTLANDPIKMSETILRSCLLGGSDIFVTDISYTLGAMELVNRMIAAKEVELGNL